MTQAGQRLIGYARVSKEEQNLEAQEDALHKAGVLPKNIYTDKVTGARAARPGLDKCLAALQEGDTLIVYRIDRLGRSLSHLVTVIEDLQERGVKFRSLCDGAINTDTASGELIFNLFSSLAQFERRLIQERTRVGLEAARARGRKGGRRPISKQDPRIQAAKRLYADRSLDIATICDTLKVSRATVYRWVAM